jgi:UDP-N-acetylmuramate dehydrogenase
MLNIIQKLYIEGCDIKKNEPLKNHTHFRIGGITPYMIFPRTTDSLLNCIHILKKEKINWKILGGGANLIVKEGLLNYLVISTKYLTNFEIFNKTFLKCEVGTPITRVSYFCAENNLSGLEFASGIPGSIGGAVFMNAGAYIGEIKDIVETVEVYNYDNDTILTLNKEELEFSYRKSIIQKKPYIILSIILKLQHKEKEEIFKIINELSSKRWNSQPLDMPSAGSIFKRPRPDFYVGTTIEKLGLKGLSVGDAQISEKHAGFIINKGNATFKEVMTLIETVKNLVKEKYGETLEIEPEIWN